MPLRQAQSLKEYVEEFTGGPNRCQVRMGGTCIRPDIFSDNRGHCDGCPYHEFCLCTMKRLHGEKKPSRPKHAEEQEYHTSAVRDEPSSTPSCAEDALRVAARRLVECIASS